jgi:Tol biopolymer transport system component
MLATTALLAAMALAGSPQPGPYFSAPFKVRANSYSFGQAPTWTRDGGVLSQEDDRHGIQQVWRSRLDGSRKRCLTCGRVKGSNGFSEERPQGDWVMFCSWAKAPVHLGGPGLGGYGSDLYVMRRNGSKPTWLTQKTDPGGGVPYDNYHPYWSPDGRHVSWTRTRAYPLAQGGQKWEIMLADFVAPKRGKPHLSHVRVVGPAFGVYETQHWAPDGSGFLFTAFGPRRSPFQAEPPGWMHQQLYFMRLYGRGASPAHPRVTLLSDEAPVYQEQAIFTPDMRDVIFMSNRNSPAGSWYNQVIAAAQAVKFDAPFPGSVGGPQFLADFSDPDFTSDLYMVDVRTRALRQLTDFHNVIPEFDWNRGYTKLLWTALVDRRYSLTQVGTFPSLGRRRISRRIPAPGLYGKPIRMSRVTGTSSARATAPPPGRVVPQRSKDTRTLPPVVATYATLWLQQLQQLAAASGADLGAPAFGVSP